MHYIPEYQLRLEHGMPLRAIPTERTVRRRAQEQGYLVHKAAGKFSLVEIATGKTVVKNADVEAVYLYILKHGCIWQRAHGLMYLTKVPKVIPLPGKIVQHNFPPGNKRRKLGADGFRAFLVEADPTKEVCNCDWAPHLGVH